MKKEIIQEILISIFEKHKIVLADTDIYEGRKFSVPKGRIVSPKWLARVISKEVKNKWR